MVDDHVKRKVLLLGDGAVGKTSMIRRFVVDKFSDDYITTIGTKVTKKDLRLESPSGATDLTFMIWDVLGQKGYKGIQDSSFQGAKGALLIYDVSRPETAESLQDYWIPHLLDITDAIPIIVVGNKVDLVASRRAAQEELDELKDALEVKGFLSSAKTGENLEAGFLALAKSVISDSGGKRAKGIAVDGVTNEYITVPTRSSWTSATSWAAKRRRCPSSGNRSREPESTSRRRRAKDCASRSTASPRRSRRSAMRTTSRRAN